MICSIVMTTCLPGAAPPGWQSVRHQEDTADRRPPDKGSYHQRGGAALTDEPRECREVREAAAPSH